MQLILEDDKLYKANFKDDKLYKANFKDDKLYKANFNYILFIFFNYIIATLSFSLL